MPPKLSRRKKYGGYAEEGVAAALTEIKSRKLSIRAAGKKYGIPPSTLADRMGRPDPVGVHHGSPPILSAGEENELERWVLEKAAQGQPYHSTDLRLAAKRLLDRDQSRTTPCKNNLPGKRWVEGFLSRHPKIKRKTGSPKLIAATETPDPTEEEEEDGEEPTESRENSIRPRTGPLALTASIAERATTLAVLESLMMRRTLDTYHKIYAHQISLPTDELYNIWKELKGTYKPFPPRARRKRRPGPEGQDGEEEGVRNGDHRPPTSTVSRMIERRMRQRERSKATRRQAKKYMKAFFAKPARKQGRRPAATATLNGNGEDMRPRTANLNGRPGARAGTRAAVRAATQSVVGTDEEETMAATQSVGGSIEGGSLAVIEEGSMAVIEGGCIDETTVGSSGDNAGIENSNRVVATIGTSGDNAGIGDSDSVVIALMDHDFRPSVKIEGGAADTVTLIESALNSDIWSASMLVSGSKSLTTLSNSY